MPSHLLHLHPSPQFQQHANDLIFPSSLLLCTAQLTKYICVYCAISAEYSEQGNDRQQRPRADALALCITSYLRRMQPSSSLKPGCITDSSFQTETISLSRSLAECSPETISEANLAMNSRTDGEFREYGQHDMVFQALRFRQRCSTFWECWSWVQVKVGIQNTLAEGRKRVGNGNLPSLVQFRQFLSRMWQDRTVTKTLGRDFKELSTLLSRLYNLPAGFNEKCSLPQSWELNTWSPVSSSTGGGLGFSAFMEEVCYWGKDLKA